MSQETKIKIKKKKSQLKLNKRDGRNYLPLGNFDFHENSDPNHEYADHL